MKFSAFEKIEHIMRIIFLKILLVRAQRELKQWQGEVQECVFQGNHTLCAVAEMRCAAGDGSTSGAAGFWGTMMGEGDVQRVVPAAGWDMDAVYSPDILPGKMSINVRCVLWTPFRELS